MYWQAAGNETVCYLNCRIHGTHVPEEEPFKASIADIHRYERIYVPAIFLGLKKPNHNSSLVWS